MRNLWITRIIFVSIFVLMSFHLEPFGLQTLPSILVGAVGGTAIIFFESRLRKVSLQRLLGAVVGSLLGILGAFLMSLVLESSLPSEGVSFINLGVLLFLGYVGIVVGSAKGETLNLAALGGVFGEERAPERSQKLLDTSVIIDGRIADVAAAGFMDGVLVVPQFVLWELQLVADSADSLKRNRGRRGLDILQKIQKMSGLNVQILETDYPRLKEVDLKLIQLAKDIDAKIVTNDFNLNKLAQLQGVQVLNINELANTLRPVVLPGESMRVFILKEGKELNQGVAYLDDGTMVVVDNARRSINQTIEVSVTSVLQTTAGKMIFGRYDEKTQPSSTSHREQERASAAPRAGGGPSTSHRPHRVEHTAGR